MFFHQIKITHNSICLIADAAYAMDEEIARTQSCVTSAIINSSRITQVTKIVNCRSRQQQLHRRMFLQGLVLAWKRYIDRFLREMRQHFSQ
jgi:hypothetical protein